MEAGLCAANSNAAASSALLAKAEQAGMAKLAALGVGEMTLRDIACRSWRSRGATRATSCPPGAAHGCAGMEDLKPGMELKGTVRNVIDFGAFVDIGVHQDGLVHFPMADKFIRHPSEVVHVGDVVTVWVVDVDVKKAAHRAEHGEGEPDMEKRCSSAFAARRWPAAPALAESHEAMAGAARIA